MDRLHAMRVYVAVADAGSFRKGASAIGLARSSVTGVIQRLEEYLGVRLIMRTTRKLSLTEQGWMYYRACKLLLRCLDRVEHDLRRVSQAAVNSHN